MPFVQLMKYVCTIYDVCTSVGMCFVKQTQAKLCLLESKYRLYSGTSLKGHLQN